MRGPNPFKLGVFSANADGGLSFTTVPERWAARWDEVQQAAVIADRGGMDFFLPIARWKGFGGTTQAREWSFETFTFAAALAAVTQRIALFMTVHVPLVHPLYAAKALATVDHISHGRAGLNIVCGWNPDEFAMFGQTLTDTPYVQAGEWAEILERLYSATGPLDFDGRYYQLKQAVSKPAALQSPRPVTERRLRRTRPRLRRAALRLSLHHLHRHRRRPPSPMCAPALKTGRDVGVYTVAHVVCRETEQEARDYYEHYSRVHEDTAAVDYHMKQKQGFSNNHDAQAYQQYRQRFAAGTGSYPLVGTPGADRGRAGAHARSGLRRRGAHLRQLRAGAALLLRTGPAPAARRRPARRVRFVMSAPALPARRPPAFPPRRSVPACATWPAPSPCWPPAAPMRAHRPGRRLPSARSAPSRRAAGLRPETLRWAASSPRQRAGRRPAGGWRAFGGSMLGLDQEARFALGAWSRPDGQTPVLNDALVSFSCRVFQLIEHASHLIVIGAVERVTPAEGAALQPSLVYHHGNFGSLHATV